MPEKTRTGPSLPGQPGRSSRDVEREKGPSTPGRKGSGSSELGTDERQTGRRGSEGFEEPGSEPGRGTSRQGDTSRRGGRSGKG